MTTGKSVALTRRTFVGKVMSLLFNTLSRLTTAFLPRSKRLLISWLLSPSAVILEPKKIKSFTVSIVSPSICHEVIGLDAMILVFWMLSFKPTFSLSFTFIRKGPTNTRSMEVFYQEADFSSLPRWALCLVGQQVTAPLPNHETEASWNHTEQTGSGCKPHSREFCCSHFSDDEIWDQWPLRSLQF